MDARVKIAAFLAYVILLFSLKNWLAVLIMMVFALMLFPVARVPVKVTLRNFKPILPIVILTALINVFLVRGGEVLFSFWKITVYRDGMKYIIMLIMRLFAIISCSSLVSYSTSPIEITTAIEFFLSPLRLVGVNTNEIAMMMTVAMRFIPTFIEEIDKIMAAQKSRGADIDTGSLFKRIRSIIPIMVPLFVSAFRRADELALAMESRCYNGGIGKTSYKVRKIGRTDVISIVVFLVAVAAVIAVNIFIRVEVL
ncbi:MAG: energy-coupling factor transporter transmembrane protein EcfT [Oscillospiraceae bacterium]|nr:energy-coupling factor transporter transmembrane protein EcfT [Oscillospiraceae bacterium]